MSGTSFRSLGLTAALTLLAASPYASAQVRVQITTVPANGFPSTNCVMTTDANGLSLVPGSTDLQATGVSFSPVGCGQGNAAPAPTPDNFALTGPASANINQAFNVSWAVSNASTCTGSASLNGSSASLPGWTDVTTATSPRTVTASVVGTYTLTLRCSNAAVPPASVNSQPLTIVVSQTGGGSCQAPAGLTRLLTSNITYGAVNLSARPNVAVTEWDNIWGHGNTTDGITPWPGVTGSSPVMRQFGRTNFVAAHFNTGAHASPTSGWIIYPTNIGGPNIDIAISPTCGDFSANVPNPGCSIQNAASDDSRAISWKFTSGNTTSYCNLQPNTDYYVNIKLHDPTSPVECAASASVCPLYTLSQGVF